MAKAGSIDGTAIAAVFSAGITVPTALGSTKYPGGGVHLPVTTVAAIQAQNGKFALLVNDTPDQVPTP